MIHAQAQGGPLEEAELRAWLRLILTPQIGGVTARRLLAALGGPQAVFDAEPRDLSALLAPDDLEALCCPPEGLDAAVSATQGWLAAADPAEGARHVLSLADPRYPQALLQIDNPPLLLFALGELAWLDTPGVAIVGSRHATAQGLDHARAFAQALAEAGLTVVSGLADGIDAAAHEGALQAAEAGGKLPGLGGSTIAVVGTGLDRVYPRKNAALARRIARQGLLLSEFLLGTPPLPPNFPRRNRIVAALGRGTLVVEAALQSGSLITARLAADLGREVLAIPGSIHAPQSRGCHALIKQGAQLVESAADVLDALAWGGVPRSVGGAAPGVSPTGGAEPADPGGADDPVLAAMGHDPVSQDALSARTGLGPAELGARLLELELDGRVARLPGQLFQRRGRA